MSAMNAASHSRRRPPERRQPEQPERDRHDADEQADHARSRGSSARTPRASRPRPAISSVVWIPVELVTPTAIGSSSTQSYGTTIVLERSRPSVSGPSTRVRDDRVVDRDRRDRQVVRLRVRDADPDLARVELDPADVELVGRRRVVPHELGQRVAGGGEGDDDRRRAAPAGRASRAASDPRRRRVRGDRARLHQSTTLKKPIQPSSANSDWCAWNMNRPVLAKSISMIPRWPWQSMTVSVYSNWSVEPVG